MALNFNQIENLIVKKRSESSVASIIISYSTLKQKLKDTENHTWYFKKGIESKRQKLASLNNDFEKIRALFNESTIDFFIHEINENNLYLSGVEGKGRSLNQRMLYSWKISNNNFFKELIRLKSKTKILMPLNYYLENPEEFLKVLE